MDKIYALDEIQAIINPITTESLNHNAGRKRTERFWSSMKEDERLIYEKKYYRNSVCMSLLQIGELTGHLTEDFRESLSYLRKY